MAKAMNDTERYWVTLTDSDGTQLVIQHNPAEGLIEVARITPDGELIDGFWTMPLGTFLSELHITTEYPR